jgi:pimeloyl-ACP methyl ester carboxylesterase
LSPPDPLVLIPGFMGSELLDAGTRQGVWVYPAWDVLHLTAFLGVLTLQPQPPPDLRMIPGGPLDTIEADGFIHYEVYTRFRRWALAKSDWGLGLDPATYYEFGYDWRKGIGEAAARLDALLQTIASARVTLVAHSQGGLVVSKLFQMRPASVGKVAKVVAIGCPFAGLVKTIGMIEEGSGVLTLLFQGDPVRTLLKSMPGTYELMPSRAATRMFRDGAGAGSTPFAVPGGTLPAAKYDAALLQQAGAAVANLPTTFPVPLRLIEGFGRATWTAAGVAAGGGIAADPKSFEGDGTCPAVSLGSVTSADLARFSLPFAEHISLVWRPEVLSYLRADLLGQPQPTFLTVEVENRTALPGTPNRLVAETRNPDGSPFPLAAPPTARIGSTPVPVQPCAIAGKARWIGTFPHPIGFPNLTFDAPGLGSKTVRLVL